MSDALTTSPPIRRYWFKFRTPRFPAAFNFGCGVSAYNYDDAVNLLRELVFGGQEPDILVCDADVDVSKLDRKRVLPNMGSVLVRGIWFPLGFR